MEVIYTGSDQDYNFRDQTTRQAGVQQKRRKSVETEYYSVNWECILTKLEVSVLKQSILVSLISTAAWSILNMCNCQQGWKKKQGVSLLSNFTWGCFRDWKRDTQEKCKLIFWQCEKFKCQFMARLPMFNKLTHTHSFWCKSGKREDTCTVLMQ